jgi:transposase-like protein
MNNDINKKPSCVYCRTTKVIKHGKTSNGNSRFRCRVCGKTWVQEKYDNLRPELADIVEAYLSGRTYRDLVNIYHSSPLRINQKIRDFLEGCPPWEEYLDAFIQKHEPRLIFLVGKEFACACKNSKNNKMFVAMAVDGISTLVLGYEIAPKESINVWTQLLDRMNCRGISCPSYLSNGAKCIEEAVNTVFPEATLRITYHKAYRDSELACCLSRLAVNNKLINDAIRAYESLRNHNLTKYLHNLNEQRLKDVLFNNPESFIRRLKDRMNHRPKTRVDGLMTAFQTRFEKFHMLKDDPIPIINGWIARFMLSRMENGFSRLSLYSQIPSTCSFKAFSCGNLPTVLELQEDSPLLKSFVIEITARGLQLPVFYFRCEMKLDKCSLF